MKKIHEFCREVVGLTYFGLDIDVYNKNSIIFRKEYFTTFCRKSFNKLLKDITILIITILKNLQITMQYGMCDV